MYGVQVEEKWQLGDEALQARRTSLKWGTEAILLRPEQQARKDPRLTIAANQILLDRQLSTSCELCQRLFVTNGS